MAVDYFLKVDGIAGESTDAKHKNEIDVVGFNFGVSNESGPGPGGGGGGAGKSIFDSLVVLAPMSKASPLLWAACASGKHIKTVVLTGRRTAMKTQADFLKVTLSDAIITSYQAEGADDDGPLDEVAFDYGKIEVAYTPVDSTGKAQPPVKAGWDLVKQTKV